MVERTVSAGLANATKLVDAAPTSSQGPDKRGLIGVAAAVVVFTGEEVRDGDFAFVVNAVRTTKVIADAEFPELNKTAEGEYVIVT